jgi:hypothetical protein
MPFTSTPNNLFPTTYALTTAAGATNAPTTGGTEAATTDFLCIKVADLPLLGRAESQPTTGDPRKIIYGFLERFYLWYSALTTGNAPTKVTVKKVSKLDTLTTESVITYTFVIRTPAIVGNDIGAES